MATTYKDLTITYILRIPGNGIDASTVHSEAVDPATALFKKFATACKGNLQSVTMTPDGFKNSGSAIM